MQFRISTYGDGEFFFEYIPRILKRRLISYCKQGKFAKIENYLDRINLGYNIIEVLEDVVDNMSISKTTRGVVYRLDTNKTFRDTPYMLSQLVYLIDDGNLEVKGTHLIQQVINEMSYYQDYYLDTYLVSRR